MLDILYFYLTNNAKNKRIKSNLCLLICFTIQLGGFNLFWWDIGDLVNKEKSVAETSWECKVWMTKFKC